MRHRFATVDGVDLHWAELGSPSAHAPLVLLHGMADSHLTWRKVAEPLARDRLVLMPDLPGFGLSGRPDASYALEWHSQIIASWLEHLALPSVDVVGHSFGGGVAQMLLLACPERLRRIVLVASGGLGREVGFWLRFAAFPFFVERFGQPFMGFGTRRAMERMHAKEGDPDIKTLAEMNAERGTARAFSRTVRDVINFRGQTRHFLHRASEVDRLPPVAVLWGESDELIPAAHGRALVERLDGAVFHTFAGCGHYVHHERPEEFTATVRGFLDAPHSHRVTLRPPPVEPRGWLAALLRVFDRVRAKT
ncbi:MAG: alpha/beta fold hydrolase [Myxococcota bacterium]